MLIAARNYLNWKQKSIDKRLAYLHVCFLILTYGRALPATAGLPFFAFSCAPCNPPGLLLY